ncbi:hypothetical protein PLICRDRAFT_177349 [Plicaturopsis crispa FD-325 SS-3]|nr:hypothetical protein PLICRDRAFT_177349 [Plicaturopsis crispa FD-325 SS-3]
MVLAVVRRTAERRHPYHSESWDDDFEDAPPLNLVMPKRRRPTQTLNSSDEDEFGAAPEEDSTVTVRVSRMPLVKASPPPPAPQLSDGTRSGSVLPPPPQRSPANSVVSIPPRSPSASTTHYGSTPHAPAPPAHL